MHQACGFSGAAGDTVFGTRRQMLEQGVVLRKARLIAVNLVERRKQPGAHLRLLGIVQLLKIRALAQNPPAGGNDVQTNFAPHFGNDVQIGPRQ